ncbi:MAG: ABC transporter ATP-binding protein [Ignavibacteriales bacterium]|nr:ABC transporter ATP-binding protein [Ignavibacteriales bacterium]
MSNDPILQTENLSKRFKKRFAVSDLNLEIFRGDIFGFLGPNGAGKSTTIRMLLSLVRPTTGDVRLFGCSVLRERSEALGKVGGIVEKPDFYLYLSAMRNLEIVGALHGGIPRSRIFEVLELVGLKERAFDAVKTYSHGMKQRLGIAQALLNDPELVILDEPTSGLDPQGTKEIRELIRHLARDRSKTVFLSSHLLSEIELVANRMAIINRGNLVVQGRVTELLESGEQRVIIRGKPLARIRTLLASRKSMVQSFRWDGNEFHATVEFRHIPALVRLLVRNGVKIEAVTPRRSLEDYFLSITESSSII